MKPIDDEKINNINTTLEERFKEERTDWNNKIIELVESIKHTSKLSEAQVIQLSYRQMIQDKLAEYRRQFYKAPVEDISQSVGVGDYKKYVIDDTNCLELGKQCPVSVQAITALMNAR